MKFEKKMNALKKARSQIKKADRATTPLAIKRKLKVKEGKKKGTPPRAL